MTHQDLLDCISEMQSEMECLTTDLEKAHKVKAAAKRCRKYTINLTKTFKDFRKLSCDLGLK